MGHAACMQEWPRGSTFPSCTLPTLHLPPHPPPLSKILTRRCPCAPLPPLQHWPFPSEHVMLGYAYILTHPGVPCILWEHYFDWKLSEQIDELVGACCGYLLGGVCVALRCNCACGISRPRRVPACPPSWLPAGPGASIG